MAGMKGYTYRICALVCVMTFCFTWAWISIETHTMYEPSAGLLGGLGTILTGAFFKGQTEK